MFDPAMPCRRATPRTPQRQLFDRLARSRGYNAGDFDIEEDRSDALAGVLATSAPLVSVRRRSTGVERIYVGGHGWLAASMLDLDGGYFGARSLRAA